MKPFTRRLSPLAFATTLLAAGPTWAATFDVPSAAYPTIAAAINAAATQGDVILVAPGTYAESLDFLGKSLTLRGTAGPSQTFLDGQGTWVLLQATQAESVVVEGFTLQNAFGSTGGAALVASSSAVFRDCVFQGNQAGDGGAVWGSSATLTFEDCTFAANSASAGGVIRISSDSPLTATRCSFTGNSAGSEGGVVRASGSSSLVLVDCSFDGNSALEGGVARLSGSATAQATGCDFIGNMGLLSGGVFRCSGDAVVTAAACEFTGNSAGLEGGVFLTSESSNPTVQGCSFTGNDAALGGGVFFLWGDNPVVIRDSVFFANGASVATATGSMLTTGANGGDMMLEGCTVVGHHEPLVSGALDGSSIRSSILWGNGAQGGLPTTTIAVNYSNVEGGYGGGGVGNLNVDPLFVDAPGGDLKLLQGSPCIDAGDPGHAPATQDVEGDPRILDGTLNGTLRIDMGADEFNHVHLAVSGSTAVGGTLTFDTSGTGGLLSVLGLGQAGALVVPPIGVLFVDPLGLPFFTVPLGTTPSSVPVVVPAGFPSGAITFQVLAVAVGAGTVSNPVTLSF